MASRKLDDLTDPERWPLLYGGSLNRPYDGVLQGLAQDRPTGSMMLVRFWWLGNCCPWRFNSSSSFLIASFRCRISVTSNSSSKRYETSSGTCRIFSKPPPPLNISGLVTIPFAFRMLCSLFFRAVRSFTNLSSPLCSSHSRIDRDVCYHTPA